MIAPNASLPNRTIRGQPINASRGAVRRRAHWRILRRTSAVRNAGARRWSVREKYNSRYWGGELIRLIASGKTRTKSERKEVSASIGKPTKEIILSPSRRRTIGGRVSEITASPPHSETLLRAACRARTVLSCTPTQPIAKAAQATANRCVRNENRSKMRLGAVSLMPKL